MIHSIRTQIRKPVENRIPLGEQLSHFTNFTGLLRDVFWKIVWHEKHNVVLFLDLKVSLES